MSFVRGLNMDGDKYEERFIKLMLQNANERLEAINND